jgi:hypothetical protein
MSSIWRDGPGEISDGLRNIGHLQRVSLRLRNNEGLPMRDVRKLTLVTLAPIAAAWAIPAQAQAEFTGAGENSELHCEGAAAEIEGASNTLTIHGPCTSLNLTGASNKITIDLAAKSTIHVVGADNEIRWTAPGDAKPRLNVVGAGNRISRRR